MKTEYKVVEDNAGMFHIYAEDSTGETFAYFAQEGASAVEVAYALLNGASATALDADFGSDENEEDFFAEFEEDCNYKIILDDSGKYENEASAEGRALLTALFYEEAMSYELEALSGSGVFPPALVDETPEAQFQALFNVGAYACPDGFSHADFERFVEKIGSLTDTVDTVYIEENADKLEITVNLRSEKYANKAFISDAIRQWFTSDAAWKQVSYEQDGASEFITLEKN